MSGASSPLRPFAGGPAVSAPLLEHKGLGPWSGRVAVRALERLRDHGATTKFEVIAEWTGPNLPEFAALAETAHASDTYWTDELELARAIALEAADELRAARIPDLRAIGARRSTSA